jgi:hypothetical protein
MTNAQALASRRKATSQEDPVPAPAHRTPHTRS